MSVFEWVQLLMWPVTVFLSVWSLAQASCVFAHQKRRAAEYAADQELAASKLSIEKQAETAVSRLDHEENLRWFDESCRHGIWLPYKNSSADKAFRLPKGYMQVCDATLEDGLRYVYIVPEDLSQSSKGYGGPVAYGSVPADKRELRYDSGQVGTFDFASHSGRG